MTKKSNRLEDYCILFNVSQPHLSKAANVHNFRRLCETLDAMQLGYKVGKYGKGDSIKADLVFVDEEDELIVCSIMERYNQTNYFFIEQTSDPLVKSIEERSVGSAKCRQIALAMETTKDDAMTCDSWYYDCKHNKYWAELLDETEEVACA